MEEGVRSMVGRRKVASMTTRNVVEWDALLLARDRRLKGDSEAEAARVAGISSYSFRSYIDPQGNWKPYYHKHVEIWLARVVGEFENTVAGMEESGARTMEVKERYLAAKWKLAKAKYDLEVHVNGDSERSHELEESWRKAVAVYNKYAIWG
jgi:hypothetical protein